MNYLDQFEIIKENRVSQSWYYSHFEPEISLLGVVVGCLEHCRMLSSISGLLPLDSSSNYLIPVIAVKKSPGEHCLPLGPHPQCPLLIHPPQGGQGNLPKAKPDPDPSLLRTLQNSAVPSEAES